MSDKALKEQIDTWIRQAYVNGSLDVNNPEPQGSDVCTELVWEAVLKDRERVVKEARIDELKNIVSPARTNKQKHLGVAYLVEDRLAELSNPTQTKKTK